MTVDTQPDTIVIKQHEADDPGVVLRLVRHQNVPNPQFWDVFFGKKNIGYIASLAIFGGSKNWTVVASMFFEDGIEHMIFPSFVDAQGWLFTEACEALDS